MRTAHEKAAILNFVSTSGAQEKEALETAGITREEVILWLKEKDVELALDGMKQASKLLNELLQKHYSSSNQVVGPTRIAPLTAYDFAIHPSFQGDVMEKREFRFFADPIRTGVEELTNMRACGHFSEIMAEFSEMQLHIAFNPKLPDISEEDEALIKNTLHAIACDGKVSLHLQNRKIATAPALSMNDVPLSDEFWTERASGPQKSVFPENMRDHTLVACRTFTTSFLIPPLMSFWVELHLAQPIPSRLFAVCDVYAMAALVGVSLEEVQLG